MPFLSMVRRAAAETRSLTQRFSEATQKRRSWRLGWKRRRVLRLECETLLPVATRYEQAGGGTSTTTERRVAFGPELPGPRPGEVRSEWQIFRDVAQRVRPDRAAIFGCESGDAIRREIAEVIPAYKGSETLREIGDAIQIGGVHLCANGVFPTPDGRAHFSVVTPPERTANISTPSTFITSPSATRSYITARETSASSLPRTRR